MGKQDTATAKYMRKNQVFADAFNYYLYGGKQVIRSDDLMELDTKEVEVPYGGEKGAKQPVQKTRDVIKSLAAMTDRNRRTVYLIMGIENQSHIHYAMPVRNMLYDALQYTKQVEEAIESHKMSGDYANTQSDEFLSGFMKDDHLIPVLTLVIYWGSKAWDGPMSLHEMCEEWDERFMAFVPDYRMNLIVPAAIADEDFEKFHSSLKEVLSFIKYSDDKDMFQSHVVLNDGFRHLGRDELDVLNACVNTGIDLDEKNMEVDMCNAFQQLKEEARAEARAVGLAEGRAEGRAEGQSYGIISMGRKHHLIDDEILRDLQTMMNLSQEKAQEFLDNYDKQIAEA